MPDKESINAWIELVKALIKLVDALGPVWSTGIALAVFGILFALLYFRARKFEKGWEKALAAKDAMIDQLNDQNREHRVETLVRSGTFSKDEAISLVYRTAVKATKV